MHFKKRLYNLLKRIIRYPYKERIYALMWKVAHLPFIKLFAYFFVEVLGGYKIYKKLKRSYGKGTVFYICPHHGTGDIYNIGLYFHSYLKKNDIKKYEFLFRGKSEQKVGRLFDIHGDTILSDRDTLRLLRFTRFAYPYAADIVQLHHYPLPDEANEHFANLEGIYEGLSFSTMFKKVVMNLSDEIEPMQPHFCVEKNIEDIFEEKGLKKGKTVILAPYSSSAQVINMDIWEDIAEKLCKAGYAVATNCILGKERPISGTTELAFEYKYAKTYLEYAGFFVGARSGLCDIISSTNCRKIVLTPFWSPTLAWLGSAGKTMRFYGMWPNYKHTDTIEVEYNYDSSVQIPDKVFDLIYSPEISEYEIHLQSDLLPKFNDKVAIALSFDEYFSPYASVTIQSIVELSNSANTYDIILLNDGISPRTKKMLESSFEGLDNFSVRFVDCKSVFADKAYHVERGYRSVIYNRLVLPSILRNFEKIIYLDADIIMNSDIAELYSLQMGQNLIAAVRDLPMIAWASDPQNPEYDNIVNKLKLTVPTNYINSGVLIFNVNRFNEELPFEFITTYIENHLLRWMDQDVFNKLCDTKILLLSQKYNVLTSLRDDESIIRSSNESQLIYSYKEAMGDPKILHFISCSFLNIDNPPRWYEKYWRIAKKSPYYELLQLRALMALRKV